MASLQSGAGLQNLGPALQLGSALQLDGGDERQVEHS
jgi:hypothetical protein